MSAVTPQRLTRAQVPVDQTWRLEDLFASPEEWEKELEAIDRDIVTVTHFKGMLGDGAQVLLDCLNTHEKLAIRLTRAYTYAYLHLQADGTNPVHQEWAQKAAALLAKVQAAVSFIESELLALPPERLAEYFDANPGFEVFRRSIEDLLETRPYRLNPETEETLAALSEVLNAPYMIYQRSKAADMQFEPVADSQGNVLPNSFALYEEKYETAPDTVLRRNAFASFTNTLKQYKNTYAAVYGTEVKRQVTLARLRGYNSVTEMLLQPEHVTLEMYHNLHDIIQSELAPHMRRLASLKKRVLNLDEMRFCDLKVPLDPDFQPATTYEEAGKVILESLQILGDEYAAIMEKALTDRWVDRADNIGKSTGAFCSSPYGVHPYILVTWADDMRSAFTLAHELGHAGHFALAHKHQTYVNSRPSRYFIEAPSTMHERLLAHHLMEQAQDKRMRRWVILQSLETYYHNYVTHMLEAEFQRRVYRLAEQGQPITANLLCDIKGSVLKEFWGDEVVIDEEATLTWMRQPHYYMGLYPFTYSAGLTISTVCAQQIYTEGQAAVDRWLAVLRAGGTLKPLELAALAGVDMSSPEPIRQAVAYVGSLIAELEESF